MTGICISLVEETTTGMIDRMADLAGVADLFEIRADLLLDLDLLTLLRAKTRPLLLTCRCESQGGRWPDDDSRRRLTLLEGVKRGFDYVDIEHTSGYLDVMMEKSGRGLVISHHDLEGTPADLDRLYAEMCDRGADIVKIAVTPKSVKDVARLLALAERTARSGGVPLVPIALGPLGAITRLTTGRYGAPFTFGAAATGVEAAPGQFSAAVMADLYRVRNVTAKTKVYGILGQNVTRSFSPVLHNRAFEARNVDAVYVPLQAEALRPFIEALPALGLSGFSVTQPYKEEILPYLNEVEAPAALCGSVNTVVVHDGGKLLGSTTDGVGVLGALKKRIDVKKKRVVMLGAGGAARSAALSLVKKGADLIVLSRRQEQARELAAALGCMAGTLDELPRLTWDVLINATPLGSAALPDETPVPQELHRQGSVVLDMVYDPLETRLLREAQAAGCVIVDGLEMLLMQATAQFETWTGLEAPADVMRAAAVVLAQQEEGA